MHYLLILQVLILLALANSAPIIAKRILGETFALPLDGNICFLDGRPIFGPSKTVRGVLVSLAATSACAPLFDMSATTGLLIASTAMAGDLLSSFVKRRFGLPSGAKAAGLDQIPESLLPLLACRQLLSLTALDIAVCTAIFFLGAVVLSHMMFHLHLRDRPY